MVFCSIYLFAFFYAAGFHHHKNGAFNKDFYFNDAYAHLSKQKAVDNGKDCLACHFVSATLILPESADFVFYKKPEVQQLSAHFSTEIITSSSQQFYLRGPPFSFYI